MNDWPSVNVATSTSPKVVDSVLTIGDVKKAIDTFNTLPPEPFAQWMTESGKSPEDGYELHLPVHLKQHFPNVPHYVRFNRAVHAPMIIPSFDIGTFKYDQHNC